MKETTKILKALGKVDRNRSIKNIGMHTIGGLKGENPASQVKAEIFFLLIDLAHELGIRDKIDKEKLSNEIYRGL